MNMPTFSLFIPQDWRVCGTPLAGKAGVGV